MRVVNRRPHDPSALLRATMRRAAASLAPIVLSLASCQAAATPRTLQDFEIEVPGDDVQAAVAAGDYQRARTLIAAQLDRCAAKERAETCFFLLIQTANITNRAGHARDAEALARTALAQARRPGWPEPDYCIALARNSLAEAVASQDRYEEALPLERLALETIRRERGPDDWVTLLMRRGLAHTLDQLGRPGEAEAELKAVIAAMRRQPKNPAVLSGLAETLNDHAGILGTLGRAREAEAEAREALALSIAGYGDKHRYVATAYSTLALALSYQGKLREALGYDEAALNIDRDAGNVATALTRYQNIGSILIDLGDYPRAVAILHDAVTSAEREGNADPLALSTARSNYAGALDATGQFAEARRQAELALGAREAALDPGHVETARLVSQLGEIAASQGRGDEAAAHFRRALPLLDAQLGHSSVASFTARLHLANALLLLSGRPREALLHFRIGVRGLKAHFANQADDAPNAHPNAAIRLALAHYVRALWEVANKGGPAR